MNINSIESEGSLEIIFTVPFGVDQSIFLWGVNCIKDSIDITSQPPSTYIWDFREDKYYTRAVIDNSELFSDLLLSLTYAQMRTFFSVSQNPFFFYGVVSCVGEKLYKIANRRKRLSRSKLEQIKKLKIETEEHIIQKIKGYMNNNKEADRIWAFSVYDGTLFNSLYIARLIKQIDPGSLILFGGDYFDFNSAEKLMMDISFIDGVIVGYGEEVFRRIISSKRQGESLSDLKIPGLVNSAYIKDGHDSEALRQLNIPPFYHDLPTHPPISYIKLSSTGAIHVLTQRGCRWGKCSFCTQIDRKLPFTIAAEQLLDGIMQAIESSKAKNIEISFDSEEVSLEFLIPLIKRFEKFTNKNVSINLRLWFQVKSFRKELISELLRLSDKEITFHFAMNFESLNFETLKNMSKGHSPLKAIESAKALLDSGHYFSTNYFDQFPLENSASIREEIGILSKVIHLFMPPKGEMIFFPYAANERDVIYNNQEKYKISVSRTQGDKWLKNEFGVDLPFSIWAYTYRKKLKFEFSSLISYIYNRIIYYVSLINMPLVCIQNFWGRKGTPKINPISQFKIKFKLYFWQALLGLMRLCKKENLYIERAAILSYVLGAKNKGKDLAKSYLYLKDKCLTKEYNIPGKEEKWTIQLSDIENRIFKYLYWSRKIDEIVDEFKREMDETEIKCFIEKHLGLGTLLKFGDSILSTVNDPQYWLNNEEK